MLVIFFCVLSVAKIQNCIPDLSQQRLHHSTTHWPCRTTTLLWIHWEAPLLFWHRLDTKRAKIQLLSRKINTEKHVVALLRNIWPQHLQQQHGSLWTWNVLSPGCSGNDRRPEIGSDELRKRQHSHFTQEKQVRWKWTTGNKKMFCRLPANFLAFTVALTYLLM